jgi:uncharacterized protein YegP (UPF0339 family)
MRRPAPKTQAVSAMRSARAAPDSLPAPAPMKFLVFEDNGGGYHWMIVAGGEALVQSASFGCYEEAKQAARIVHAGASQASFERRSPDTLPVDLPARRDAATARDDQRHAGRAPVTP